MPSAGTNYYANDSLVISINATDGSMINPAIVRITRPDAEVLEYNISNLTKDIYRTTFAATNITGQYNVSFRINDTWNNTANFSTTFSIVASSVLFSNTIVSANPTNVTWNVTFKINITNSGTTNLTNISFRHVYNVGYFNFTNSSTVVDNASLTNGVLILNPIDGNHGFGTLLANGSSIVFNVTYRAPRISPISVLMPTYLFMTTAIIHFYPETD